MSFFAVSDLHIWGPKDPLYESLVRLIRDRTETGDTLVLAGDLFDLFVGNKKIFTHRYPEFFEALAQAGGRGVHLHYIEGNHDFLLQGAFRGIPHLQVHPREMSVQISGKQFYVAHGDLVDRKDYGYLFLRAFFRSPFMKAFVKLAPGKWIDWIGQTSSRRSRQHKPLLVMDLPLNRIDTLRKAYRSYAAEKLSQGYDYVVMGHCHDLDEMSFNIGGRPGQYINVGFPRTHGSFLSWSPGDEKVQRERMPGPDA